LDYQFNSRKLNPQIFEIFERLKAKMTPQDIAWKKALTEMDIRNHKVGEYDEKIGGFPVEPQYDEEVSKFIDDGKGELEHNSKSMSFSSQLAKVYEGNEKIEFQVWATCYQQYSDGSKLNVLYDRPVALAVIGLRDFISNLDGQQKQWCIETIVGTVVMILEEAFESGYGFNMNYNLMDKEVSLSNFHLLFSAVKEVEDRNELISLMIYVLFAPLAEHEVAKIVKYIRTIFFKHHPQEGKRIWLGLIKYSQYRKSNPYFYDDQDTDRLNTARQKEAAFVKQIAASKKIKLDLSEIDFQTFRGSILVRVFAITPYYNPDADYAQFIERFISLFLEDLNKKENYSYNRIGNEDRQISHHDVTECRNFLIELALRGDHSLTKKVINLILDAVDSETRPHVWGRDDLADFVSNLLDFTIYELDTILSNSNDENEKTLLINNFWELWAFLLSKIETNGKHIHARILLLDIKWKESATHWLPLEGKKDFYYDMIEALGPTGTQSVINVFSTVGEKTFLPDGITLLVNLFKNDVGQSLSLISPSGERLIKRLFYNHITEIKNSKQLINDLIWLLNKMVDLGSSEAYMFRENVITFKQPS